MIDRSATLPANLEYTEKDFDALRTRLYGLIQSVFPTLTAQEAGDFTNILIEGFCFVGDVLCFYQDGQSREAFIGFVTQYKNLLNITKMIGYRPAGQTASRVEETFRLASGAVVAPGAQVLIPTGQIVKSVGTGNEVAKYQSLSLASISAGQNSVDVVMENSVARQERITCRNTPDQEFIGRYDNFLDGTMQVTKQPGPSETWEVVEDFLESGPNDKHVVAWQDHNGKPRLRFGDGNQGKVPSGSLTLEYRTGGGTAGEVAKETLTVGEGLPIKDSLGNIIKLECINQSASTPATERETINAARINAPASLRLLTRAVAREDYEIGANQVSGVARSLMITSGEDSGIEENTGVLYVVTPDATDAPQTLLSAVSLQFEKDPGDPDYEPPYPKTVTFRLTVQNADYLDLNLEAIVYLSPGWEARAAEAKANIHTSLAELLVPLLPDGTPNPYVDFGYNFKDVDGNPAGEIPLSDVYNAVRDATGIRKVSPSPDGFTINGDHADVQLLFRQFPRLGTVTLINGDTGDAL